MEKVTQFLEKYVQWIVLGLAFLFAVYMAYSYHVEQPVSVEVNGQKLMPGEINPVIVNGPVRAIESDLTKPAPEMVVKDFVGTFAQNMTLDKPEMLVAFKPLTPQVFPGAGNVGEIRDDSTAVAGGWVKTLPEPPAVTTVAVSSGRAAVRLVDPAAPAAPAAPPRPGVAPVRPAADEADVDWVSVGGTIEPAEIAAAWAKSFTNPDDAAAAVAPVAGAANLNQTRFLRVEMQREELMPDGTTWGKAQTVPALRIHQLKPFPAPDATEQERLEYLDWAVKNDALLAAPTFYTVAGGLPWYAPGSPAPTQVRNAAAPPPPGDGFGLPPGVGFDPANPPKRKLTPDEKRMVDDHKKMLREQQQIEREMRKGGRPPKQGVRGPAPRLNGGGNVRLAGATADDVAGAAVQLAQYQPPPRGNPGPYGPGYRDPSEFYRGGEFGPGGGGEFGYNPGFQQAPGALGGGRGAIDIGTLAQPIQIWAHDETVVPGKTYRYRLRYSLLNPVHNAPNLAADKKLEDILYVTSPWSAWTDKVEVSERAYLYLAGNPTAKEAKFEVFVWQGGGWKAKEEKASPGDTIPGTSWMVVDLRPNNRAGGQVDVLLVNANGTTDRRNPRRDQEDPLRLQLQEESAAAVSVR